ncbi:MAG: MFS transporter [Candidatus Eremiobacteraeota bacterium]|nr:MFS transporter [Candidatus Eremiobacteraeota bacterium]
MPNQSLPPNKLAIALGTSLIVQTAISFGAQIVGPLAPALRAGLGLSSSEIALLVGFFFLGATLLLIPAGTITDRIGPRPLFFVGPALVFAAFVAASRSTSFVPLVAAMLVAGLGNALTLPSTTRAIMDWFRADQGRATAMSIKQTGVALAGVIMALTVPAIVVPLGWRMTMLVVGAVTFASGALSALLYTPGPLAREIDRLATAHHDRERRPKLPVQTIAIAAYTFLIAGVQLTFQSFFVLFLHDQMGYALPLAGVLLALAQGSGVAARIGWSVVSDSLFNERRRPALLAISLLALATAIGLALSTASTSFAAIVAFAILFGASAIGWNGVVMVFVTESAGIARAATAASINLASSYVAIFVVPPLFGAIVDATHGYHAAFALLAALVLLTLGCIVPMREITSSDVSSRA